MSSKVRLVKFHFFLMIHHQISLKIKKEHLFFTILSESTHSKLSFEPLMTYFGYISQEVEFVSFFGGVALRQVLAK